MSAPVIYIDVRHRKAKILPKRRMQTWFWHARSAGNSRILCSGEAYYNLADCLHAIDLLFGTGSTVFLRQAKQGNQLIRLGVVDNGGTESDTGEGGE